MAQKFRIGVINPNWGFLSGEKTMHRWAEVFIRDYAEVLSYEEAKTYDGDAVICLNGRPDLKENHPPKEFKGLKAVHLMDHTFQVQRTRKVLKEHEIEMLLAYNEHDLFDPFFQHFYPDYIGKVIPVPFGFNDKRFWQIGFNTWKWRVNKVAAFGAVNPVSDPLCIADIKDYAEFNKHEEFTHKWRRQLFMNKAFLASELDSFFPEWPKTKDFDYDIVQAYNQYKMFTTCESIMFYPSVKTFEGMACGSVFVASDHPCYDKIGLMDGVNCIKHKQYSIEDFKEKVNYYQEHEDELAVIAENGIKFVNEFYRPDKIALNLYTKLTQYAGHEL